LRHRSGGGHITQKLERGRKEVKGKEINYIGERGEKEFRSEKQARTLSRKGG